MQPLNPNAMPPAQMPAAMFPGSIPMEPNSGFSHDGRMIAQPMPMAVVPNMQPPAPMPQDAPWQGAVQVNQAQPMPLPSMAPALEPADGQIQQRVKLNHAIKADQTFELDEKLWAFAKCISSSVFVPACIRSTQVNDHTGDVYLLMLRARSLGLSATQAFSDLYVITQKTGDAKIGMYVKTKAAICAAYGEWSVDMLPDGSAIAKGKRYSNGQVKEVVYSVDTAAARGMVSINNQGRLVGVGKWADKLEDMMRTRALGRLLDTLFPDVISGVVSMDELNDDDYERSLRQSLEPSPVAAQTIPQDAPSQQVQVAEDKVAENASASDGDISLAAAVSKTRRNKRSTKVTPPDVIEAAPAPQELTPTQVPSTDGLLTPLVPQPEAVPAPAPAPEPNPFAAPSFN